MDAAPQTPLDRIRALLQRTSGIDLRQYKSVTVQRKLQRRLEALQCEHLAAYADRLESDPDEVQCLRQELLISVTRLFRDAEAFAALNTALTAHLRTKAELDELRIWVAGCAGGAEAYSIALLVAEIQRLQGRQLATRIFATDLDEAAVEQARRGRFTRQALAAVPADLRARYFTDDRRGECAAIKSLRDLLIFSVHNLSANPAFSRLDVVSCRNVLSHLRPELQAQLLGGFHHALTPGGLLFLGKSESPQHAGGLFLPVDERHRIYRRIGQPGSRVAARVQTATAGFQRMARGTPRDRSSVFERLMKVMPGKLLPPSVLVDAELAVRHVFGDVSAWVKLGAGEFSTDLHHLLIPSLRLEVRSLALRAQRDAQGFVEHTIQSKALERPVRVSVLRLDEDVDHADMLLVSFKPLRQRGTPSIDQDQRDAAHYSAVTQLEEQLSSTREHLHTVIEELETSNEELQSFNEEMQSSNEELTSANEELETANEELQSTNEELTTVNEELENKGRELSALTADLLNVKNSLAHPMVVTDARGLVVLVNDRARAAFKLPADVVGRSIFALPDLQQAFGDRGELAEDVRNVQTRQVTLERQVEGPHTGLLTVSPYRNDQGECSGVVLMFMDNAALKAAERDLLTAQADLAAAGEFSRQTLDALPQAVCVIDATCRIRSVNRLWQRAMAPLGDCGTPCGVGADYAAACAASAARGDSWAARFLAGMQAVITGTLEHFVHEYCCDSPAGTRWFLATVTPFSRQACRHWLVMHADITERKQHEHTILLQSLALETDAGGVFIADASLPQLPIVYVNQAFERITRTPRAQLIGRDFTRVLPGLEAQLRATVARQQDDCIALTLPDPGTERHAELTVHWINRQGGQAAHISGILQDVTERVHLANRLRDTLAHENLALKFAEIGSLEWHLRSGQLKCSALQMQLLGMGHEARDLPHADFLKRVHPGDQVVFNDALRLCLTGHAPFSLDFRVIHDDGSVHWLRCRGNARLDGNGTPLSVLCLTLDITCAKESELQARFLAHHDSLTGLANRALLEDRLQQAIRVAQREQRKLAVVFIDLDRFKEINDMLGHAAGDDVLKQASARLQAATRRSDSVCRHSGDEFIVLLPGIHDADEVGRLVAKIGEAVRAPMQVAGREVTISASIGISLFPEDGDNASTLIRHADAAMYHAKSGGRNGFEFFSAELNQQMVKRIEVAIQLRRGIAEHQLELHYQPQVNVHDGQLVGVEALVRWRHPEHGLLLPDAFIPHAEDTDLIHEIGDWVLQQACEQNRRWQRLGLPRVPVAVNVSPLQFRKADFVERLGQLLHATGLAPEYLELEITERVLMNQNEAATRALAACQALGVRFSIDDFGTGHSSLTYLLQFPVARIKIDRSFVAVAPEQRAAAAIVRSVIQLGHGLGQQIVAEGVESAAQLALLREEGCDAFQGYLCAPPLNAGAFQSFLETFDGTALVH